MRVLCIQKANFRNGNTAQGFKQPVENEVYNTVAEFNDSGHIWYILAEFGFNDWFISGMFIPLSDLDETELENESHFLKEQQW